MEDHAYVVVGGGLAGLTAAATLATSGCRVTVLEAGESIGGRARSRHRDGFTVNLGPHALFRSAGGVAVLRSLGIRTKGGMPRLHRAGIYRDGGLTGAWGWLWREADDRRGLLRTALGGGPSAAAELAGTPAQEWITHVTRDGTGRAALASLLRLVTYSADLSLLDAGAAARQLRVGAQGVVYLHGGWSRLVDQLADVVRAYGGEIRTCAGVEGIDHDEVVEAVRLTDGTRLAAGGVVVAAGTPQKVAGWLEGAAARKLAATVADAVPIRMAHLDVCVRPLPERRHPNVLGVDAPLYLVVASSASRTAPDGGAVLHAARYLRPGDDHGDHRGELEAFLDTAQPGWRDHVVDARYVPRSLVAADHARWATRGTLDRPGVGASGVAGLALAGDWVGPTGTLADASICSGADAARLLLEHRHRARRASHV